MRRWTDTGVPAAKANIDEFVRYEKIKWSESLKANLRRERYANVRRSRNSGRPYTVHSRDDTFCFNEVLIERRYQFAADFSYSWRAREQGHCG